MDAAARGAPSDGGVGGAVVVFAKCPLAGASKTRLAPLLGAEGAASLAKAMLSDVLVTISGHPPLSNTLKVLMYAPGTTAGESQMISILGSLHLLHYKVNEGAPIDQTDAINKSDDFDSNGWILLPMKSSSAALGKSDLTSSSLGDKLEDALVRVRTLIGMKLSSVNANEAVLFLGMDSPELPLEEVVYGLQTSSGHMRHIRSANGPYSTGGSEQDCIAKAHMCPANDGGYGLLSVPTHAPSDKIFSLVRWSNPLTAVSQLKTLTDNNVDVSIGKLMYDIDEPADVKELAMRLAHRQSKKNDAPDDTQSIEDSLSNLSSGISTIESTDTADVFPHHTWKALLDLNVIDGKNE